MNSSDSSTNERLAALQAELAAIKKQDAEFRTNMIQEFLDRGERNSYVHTLHEERAALRQREQESFSDLEVLVRKLEAANGRANAAEAELAKLRRSWSWRLTAPWRVVSGGFGGAPSVAYPLTRSAPVDGGVFTYFLHTSPFRVFREASFTVRGWAWPQDGRAVTAIRIALGSRTFIGRHGLPEPEVISRYGEQPNNPRPGFEITFEPLSGEHTLSLEAQLDGQEWRRIMHTTVWCEPHP